MIKEEPYFKISTSYTKIYGGKIFWVIVLIVLTFIFIEGLLIFFIMELGYLHHLDPIIYYLVLTLFILVLASYLYSLFVRNKFSYVEAYRRYLMIYDSRFLFPFRLKKNIGSKIEFNKVRGVIKIRSELLEISTSKRKVLLNSEQLEETGDKLINLINKHSDFFSYLDLERGLIDYHPAVDEGIFIDRGDQITHARLVKTDINTYSLYRGDEGKVAVEIKFAAKSMDFDFVMQNPESKETFLKMDLYSTLDSISFPVEEKALKLQFAFPIKNKDNVAVAFSQASNQLGIGGTCNIQSGIDRIKYRLAGYFEIEGGVVVNENVRVRISSEEVLSRTIHMESQGGKVGFNLIAILAMSIAGTQEIYSRIQRSRKD